MAVERFLEFFAAAIDERPDAGRVWSGGGAVPGVVRGSSRSASSSRNRASRSLPGGIERTQAQVLADAVLKVSPLQPATGPARVGACACVAPSGRPLSSRSNVKVGAFS